MVDYYWELRGLFILKKLALVTGGSDYHDDGEHHARLGETAMSWVSAKEDVDALKSAIEAAQ